MAAEHIQILENLRTILQSLDAGSDLFEAQIEAIELFKTTYHWQLQNTFPEENIMTKPRRT